MDELTQAFRQFAQEKRADLIGIAPIERFEGVPTKNHPCSIFPETKSVIVIGKRITRGTLRGLEEGTQFDIYGQYGLSWLADRMLAMTTISLATWIEDNQWEAVPVQDLPPQVPPSGVAVKPDAPAPNVMVDVRDAAIRAGLGEVGYSGEVLTPQFGPRQRFQIILTDAVLEPTALCETSVCTQCKQCAASCPLDAISADESETVAVCGKEMTVGKINYDTCRSCQNGAGRNPNHPAGLPDRLGALCNRTCVHSLEKADAVENTFAGEFRKRPAWQKDATGKASLQGAV
ncbi:MAG: hypothetical protein HN742_30110 [Lentisphaerae bacterium]|nr:hypothetical protein [Lentisphaerota bacterium]MBT5612696.1 hypothetical protein [Lentisphaerota bacterium]MBT7057570.1 hypothetical protein [Lentisphaerota bacterium]MBT7846165.1 hypothetical protein [Lentisphaerota bacterium]